MNKKTIYQIVLVLAAIVLAFLIYNSIMNPVRFNQEVDDAITLTGAEDFLKSAFYFDTIQQNSMGGVTAMDKVNGKYTGYTMNYHFPIPYIDGMSGHFPSVNTLNTQCNFTSVYYEEQ